MCPYVSLLFMSESSKRCERRNRFDTAKLTSLIGFQHYSTFVPSTRGAPAQAALLTVLPVLLRGTKMALTTNIGPSTPAPLTLSFGTDIRHTRRAARAF
jgi:hypothetical protein